MRCKACNTIMDEFELTKKDANGEFIDLCTVCLTATANAGIDTDTMEYYQYEVFTEEENCDTLY